MDDRYDDPEYEIVIGSLKNRLYNLRSELNEIDEQFPEIQKVIEVSN